MRQLEILHQEDDAIMSELLSLLAPLTLETHP
jgi:hypothetical protein